MRHMLFHLHQHSHHVDFENGLLILYLLVYVGVLTWGAWHLLSVLSKLGSVINPAPMHFWPY